MPVFYSTFVLVKEYAKYMSRCLYLAEKGVGFARPNPSVGCVIVHGESIIGEGFTSPYGGPHAEVNAIAAVENKSLLTQATMYVTMEPCSHYGKTPPCADAIVRCGIPKVVIGLVDLSKKVNGTGVERMRAAGVEVCYESIDGLVAVQHRRFNCFETKKRPYVVLKWAESNDGFLAPLEKETKRPVWLTNVFSRQLVHKWRAKEQAILVGANTVLEDNPKLDVRNWGGLDPVIVLFDPKNKIPQDHSILNSKKKIILFNSQLACSVPGNLLHCSLREGVSYVQQMLSFLFKQQIQSLFVEGGAKTLNLFLEEGFWDEVFVFSSSVVLNVGIQAPQVNESLGVKEIRIFEDRLTVYKNVNG